MDLKGFNLARRPSFTCQCITVSHMSGLNLKSCPPSLQEVEVLHLVSDHPNIAELKVAYEDSAAVHLVLEMCKGGELFDRRAPAAGWLLPLHRTLPAVS